MGFECKDLLFHSSFFLFSLITLLCKNTKVQSESLGLSFFVIGCLVGRATTNLDGVHLFVFGSCSVLCSIKCPFDTYSLFVVELLLLSMLLLSDFTRALSTYSIQLMEKAAQNDSLISTTH